jgi:hypothetical protein
LNLGHKLGSFKILQRILSFGTARNERKSSQGAEQYTVPINLMDKEQKKKDRDAGCHSIPQNKNRVISGTTKTSVTTPSTHAKAKTNTIELEFTYAFCAAFQLCLCTELVPKRIAILEPWISTVSRQSSAAPSVW